MEERLMRVLPVVNSRVSHQPQIVVVNEPASVFARILAAEIKKQNEKERRQQK
jgi:hypothetical protein